MPSRRNCRSVVAAQVLLLASFLIVGPAAAEKRIALVIGNSGYQHISRLENPVNDAKLMADTLRSLGFTLVGGGPRLDLDRADFDRAVQEFGRSLSGADVALFYFAGHGVQVRGANYLVPVGANPVREADVDFQMLDTNLVLRQMEGSGTRLNLVILDACRNNPFGGRGLRSSGSGLATMQAPEGTLISFATQPGSVALDGNAANSPFTRALVDAIRKPGLGLFDTFNAVGLEVKKATGGAQQPWVSSSPIGGNFFFAGHPGGSEPAASQPSEAAVTALQQRLKALEEELQRREQARIAAVPPPAAPPPSVPQALVTESPIYPPPLFLPPQTAKPGASDKIVSQIFVAGQSECESLCIGKSACRSYRFDEASKRCTFLSNPDGIKPKATASSSLPPAAPPPSVPQSLVTEPPVYPPPLFLPPQTAKPGAGDKIISQVFVSGQGECESLCIGKSACRSYRFDEASKRCTFLSNSNGIKPKATASSSLPVPPAVEPQTYTHSFVADGFDCRNLCAQDRRCKSFMFDPPSKMCQLLEGTNPSSFNVVR